MPPSIAVVAPGAMGSAIATRLVEHGCKVLTLLKGRSAATQARAAAAGMTGASEAEIANADIILSIVPPGEAVALAEQLATLINRNAKKPVVVDCNAVNVETIRTIEDIVLSSGARLVDAAIIGLPPKPGTKGPAFYVSGDAAGDIAVLGQLGLDLRLIEGPIGAASALKMSYAGINKGLTGLGAAMVLAATRAGAADALRDELALSLPQVQARLANALPDMLPKAYRWVAEMREIAGFLGPDHPAALIYEGFARLFEHIAADVQGQGTEAAQLVAFAERCKAKT
ncbi:MULTISPECIES: NAD(P)-dependent oxidoreductase [Bradyrhizobium]|jgi:3-hydroxyisobutyrate dehydrogenase-like beta-hydroxyacid dehydrogenase|uniref:NAD(P)-dependent oxidoreductase n=2 Tax=Nitrobacteraceae TaxID=41294 RepID=UPI0003A6AD79|nr:NAD(P)-dependent oxidoreductase [Bradyrhizobium denitrificans]RTM04520.1 MAG: NAD(P)-dependent oxidoreductase [Bradyrhizobiaceae bacterium]